MPADAHRTAAALAAALDADDFAATMELLAPDCVYDAPEGRLSGPEAIVDSYRMSSVRALQLFDAVVYRSEVQHEPQGSATITFIDWLRHGHETHTYRCRQVICCNDDGKIDSIRHREIPGEREALRAFCKRRGIEL